MELIKSDFFTEFTELVDQLILKPAIPWDIQHSAYAKRLIDLLHLIDLYQTVTEHTHEYGHQPDNLLKFSHVSSQMSDHCVVHSILSLSKPRFFCKCVSYRKYGCGDIGRFKEDFINSEKLYYSLTNLLDEHVSKK